jgi:quinol monooxygenase YgiN
MSEKIAVIAKLVAAPGKRDELVSALEKMFPVVEDEKGTEVYALHLDTKNDDVAWFYELYAGGDALKAHSSSDAMKGLQASLGSLAAPGTEIIVLKPVRAKGIDV